MMNHILLAVFLFSPLTLSANEENSNIVTLNDTVTFEAPPGWDVSKSETGSVAFVKPLGVSGIRIARITAFPPEPNQTFGHLSPVEIDGTLWKLPWRDPSFWNTEPTTELPQSYTRASAVDLTTHGIEWTCVRHFGVNVSDIGICFTPAPFGVVAVTYLSKTTNVSPMDVDVHIEDIEEVLRGVSF